MVDRIRIDALDIAVSGGTMAAFRLGDAPAGRPLVVAVHGITANSRAWLPVARALEQRATLIAPDLRGRGASSSLPGPYGFAAHVADMTAILDQLGLDSAVFVGHSLGAYIVARLAVEHPQRVDSLVLVDGGLPIPGSEAVPAQEFADALLGPAIARLKMRFPNRQSYYAWWRKHPAFASGDVAGEDLIAYADHDLVGDEPDLRSAVAEAAVRADIEESGDSGFAAQRLAVQVKLLCAPRGLLDDAHPMQPLALAQAWAAQAPVQREAMLVDGVNHYTITLGSRGAHAVAEAITDGLRLIPD